MRGPVRRPVLELLIVMAMVYVPVPGVSAQEPDFNAALKAAEQGNAAAQMKLGFMYEMSRDYVESRIWYRKAAVQGDAGAQWELGLSYQMGLGVPRDHVKARAWCLKAAEQGLKQAQLNLAFMFAEGQGGRKDYVQAYKWGALAGSEGVDFGLGEMAKAMTPAQLVEAKRLVSEWKRKKAGRGGVAKN